MTGVSDINKCPICGGPMETYLQTRTNETDNNCLGACGYEAHREIITNQITGLNYWEETQSLPISKDGTMVARPEGQHKWNKEEFPSADCPVKTVLVLEYVNANLFTGLYTMITDREGKTSVPPIEWDLRDLELSRRDIFQLQMQPDEGKDWHSVDYCLTFGEDGVKQFNRVSSAPLWEKNPLLVQDVESYRLAPDFDRAALVPEKDRAIRFAILKAQIGEEIEEIF